MINTKAFHQDGCTAFSDLKLHCLHSLYNKSNMQFCCKPWWGSFKPTIQTASPRHSLVFLRKESVLGHCLSLGSQNASIAWKRVLCWKPAPRKLGTQNGPVRRLVMRILTLHPPPPLLLLLLLHAELSDPACPQDCPTHKQLLCAQGSLWS